jgi:Calcineurin-like phosphoesterase
MRKLTKSTLVAALAASALVAPGSASAKGHDDSDTFAVIGDIPYGDAQIAAFPDRIRQINADPDVSLVVHLGDIKSGSSLCSDQYFAMIKGDFDTFADPLVYTPGDNEWTDCHRPNNGGYIPLERLAAVRSLFFSTPGLTLGQRPVEIDSQAAEGIPENVRWRRDHVQFVAVDIPGSNNSLAPWTGNTTPTPDQTVEVMSRTAADIELIRDTFRDARDRHDDTVVIMTQADMFDPTVANPQFADYFGFKPIVTALVQEASTFSRRVYLFNGDSHVFNSDHPLAAGSPWLGLYGITTPLDNLERVTVEGSTGVDEWLKVRIDKHGRAPLAIERMPFEPLPG